MQNTSKFYVLVVLHGLLMTPVSQTWAQSSPPTDTTTAGDAASSGGTAVTTYQVAQPVANAAAATLSSGSQQYFPRLPEVPARWALGVNFLVDSFQVGQKTYDGYQNGGGVSGAVGAGCRELYLSVVEEVTAAAVTCLAAPAGPLAPLVGVGVAKVAREGAEFNLDNPLPPESQTCLWGGPCVLSGPVQTYQSQKDDAQSAASQPVASDNPFWAPNNSAAAYPDAGANLFNTAVSSPPVDASDNPFLAATPASNSATTATTTDSGVETTTRPPATAPSANPFVNQTAAPVWNGSQYQVTPSPIVVTPSSPLTPYVRPGVTTYRTGIPITPAPTGVVTAPTPVTLKPPPTNGQNSTNTNRVCGANAVGCK